MSLSWQRIALSSQGHRKNYFEETIWLFFN